MKPRLTLHGFRIKSLSIERISRDANLGPPAEVKHTQASLIIALGEAGLPSKKTSKKCLNLVASSPVYGQVQTFSGGNTC